MRWLEEDESPFSHEQQYSNASTALDRVSETLAAWKKESLLCVANSEPIWIGKTRAKIERVGIDMESVNSTSSASRAKRDLLMKYGLAYRAGLINSDEATLKDAPVSELTAAILQLQREADKQNFLNCHDVSALKDMFVDFDFQADRAYVRRHATILDADRKRLRGDQDAQYNHCHHCGDRVAKVEEDQFTLLHHHLGPSPTCVKCYRRFCRSCLHKTYDQTFAKICRLQWTCPRCEGKCWCSRCIKQQRSAKLFALF